MGYFIFKTLNVFLKNLKKSYISVYCQAHVCIFTYNLYLAIYYPNKNNCGISGGIWQTNLACGGRKSDSKEKSQQTCTQSLNSYIPDKTENTTNIRLFIFSLTEQQTNHVFHVMTNNQQEPLIILILLVSHHSCCILFYQIKSCEHSVDDWVTWAVIFLCSVLKHFIVVGVAKLHLKGGDAHVCTPSILFKM